ncbi:tetratricopeptide repeat protein [Bradyrhizobium sp.]|jgi:tetratricopeptide (TPR) repeat protein|uniref:tetratricopeptide repeat protein n=1 Tax=Bradyrhizobium sp. TaxID=376 RepID=UPI003C1D5C96
MTRRERRAAHKDTELAVPATTTAAALHEAAVRHFSAGEYLEAQLCCQQALERDAANAETLHLMGVIALQAHQYDHAVEWISRAIRQQPKADYLTSLATALQRQGRHNDALLTFDKAVRLKPDDGGLWRNLGSALADAGRLSEAALSFQHALKLDPCLWDAAFQAGFLLHHEGRSEEALELFKLHEKMPPESNLALQMRALAMYIEGRFEQGLVDITRAQERDPANAGLCNQLGVFLQRLHREAEALPWFDRALALQPDFIGALRNKAFTLTNIHRFVEALAVYDEIKALDPDDAKADFDASLVELLIGNFEAGWAGREARSKLVGFAHFDFPQARWLGRDSIAGKTILVVNDEGFGDLIQFARYIPMLAALGARVILLVEDPAVSLLSGMAGVAEVLPKSAGSLPHFDLYCPVCSLPLAFDTRLETIPASLPYLPSPDVERVQAWEDRLGPRERLRIGVVWSGNPVHFNDHNRSIPLKLLVPVLDADATFISIQKDPRDSDAAILRERSDIIDLTSGFADFAETAALIACLDIVITVDTSIAHLAGALGRPTWILLPHTPDWRWLTNRDDNPWYPSVRLFRQDETRDYKGVIARVRGELMAMTAVRQAIERPLQ